MKYRIIFLCIFISFIFPSITHAQTQDDVLTQKVYAKIDQLYAKDPSKMAILKIRISKMYHKVTDIKQKKLLLRISTYIAHKFSSDKDIKVTGTGAVPVWWKDPNKGTWTTLTWAVQNGDQTIIYTPILELKKMEQRVPSLYFAYSPATEKSIGDSKIWFWWWLTQSDKDDYLRAVASGSDLSKINGADKIFLSSFTWATKNSPGQIILRVVFAKQGYHVNDPTIIVPPSETDTDRSKWLYMYYTSLQNQNATSTWRTSSNEVGLASSKDGGTTWIDRWIVIKKDEWWDSYGAWSPSAIVVGNEIWVYYHTGKPDFSKPINFRQKFKLNGIDKIGEPQRLSFSKDYGVQGKALSNIDVVQDKDDYYLVGNSLDLSKIYIFHSLDGMLWDPIFDEPAIDWGVHKIFTPHVRIEGNYFTLYFWYGDINGESKSIEKWTYLKTKTSK